MLSESASNVKNDNSVRIDFSGDSPVVSSLDVALHFQKNHFHVLREIRRLMSQLPEIFVKSNFGFTSINTNTGIGIKKNTVCNLTRDAFTLLAMGFSGQQALAWKLKYIEAFNQLEKIAIEKKSDMIRQEGYAAGKAEALSLPILEAERKKGYLAGMKEGERMAKKRDKLYILERLLCYRKAGLTQAEMGKCLGLNRNIIQKRIKEFKKKGFWPKKQAAEQLSLLEAGDE